MQVDETVFTLVKNLVSKILKIISFFTTVKFNFTMTERKSKKTK